MRFDGLITQILESNAQQLLYHIDLELHGENNENKNEEDLENIL